MRFHDLLLHIDTYPTPTPDAAIEEAVRLAAHLGGKLTALALEIEIPVQSNRLADYLIGLSGMAREFLLGGATQHILTRVPCPTLLSH